MTKKLYISIALACILLIIALVYDFGISTKTHVGTYADLINEHLHQQEAEVESFFENKAFINRQLQSPSNVDVPTQEQDFLFLKQLSEKDYSITIHKNDSLVFWTNNIILPSASDRAPIGADRYYEFKNLENGYYELIGQSYKDNNFW